MNPEVKALWVQALRSGRFKQGRGVLHRKLGSDRPDEFCCLGVLCVLAAESGVVFNVNVPRAGIGGNVAYDLETSVLPPTVCRWAGLDSSNPALLLPGDTEVATLAALNDGHLPTDPTAGSARPSLDFAAIADLIEEHL